MDIAEELAVLAAKIRSAEGIDLDLYNWFIDEGLRISLNYLNPINSNLAVLKETILFGDDPDVVALAMLLLGVNSPAINVSGMIEPIKAVMARHSASLAVRSAGSLALSQLHDPIGLRVKRAMMQRTGVGSSDFTKIGIGATLQAIIRK